MKLLFLAHRSPWPPDKGDRLRSHGILRWLARRHEVFLGAFGDNGDSKEAQAVEDHLRPLCADIHIVPRPPLARGLLAAVTGRPISFEIMSSRRLTDWAKETARRVRPDAAFAYSGQMAPPLMQLSGMPRVVDLVDVDSAKWRARFERSHNPIHLIESRRVRKFEERCMRELDAVTLTSRREAEILGGENGVVHVVRTGVDLDYFQKRAVDPGGARIAFVGALDYAPNAEGIVWFAREVLPRIRAERPGAELVVIGRKPPAALTGLTGVHVTGWVDDIRPVMQGCAIAVVPINESNGVQTKALVGMALGLPTVMTSGAAEGVEAQDGRDALVADDPLDFASAVLRLLDNRDERERLSSTARSFVESHCDWERNLTVLERLLAP